MTCYVSSIITNEDERGKGCGVKLMDHAKELAKARGCKALVLDSACPASRPTASMRSTASRRAATASTTIWSLESPSNFSS